MVWDPNRAFGYREDVENAATERFTAGAVAKKIRSSAASRAQERRRCPAMGHCESISITGAHRARAARQADAPLGGGVTRCLGAWALRRGYRALREDEVRREIGGGGLANAFYFPQVFRTAERRFTRVRLTPAFTKRDDRARSFAAEHRDGGQFSPIGAIGIESIGKFRGTGRNFRLWIVDQRSIAPPSRRQRNQQQSDNPDEGALLPGRPQDPGIILVS